MSTMAFVFLISFSILFHFKLAVGAPAPLHLNKTPEPPPLSLNGTSKTSRPQSRRTKKNCNRKQIRKTKKLLISLKFDTLKKHQNKAITCLENIAFSKEEPMRLRWMAITSMIKLDHKTAYSHLRRALLSPVWFMRNAGLISLEQYKPKEALAWANRLLYDPSLVVRTVAVNIIKKHGDKAFKARLKQALNAPQNFYKGKSLWIRHHIVSTLAQFATPDEIHFFTKLLDDQDQRLHTPAALALKSINNQTENTIASRQNRLNSSSSKIH